MHMNSNRYLFVFGLVVCGFLIAGCGVDTTGLSAESSKTPKGSASAAVTVTEYGDLQCPACQGAHTLVNKPLLEKYGNRIRFEFKHFPLQTIHPYAMEAAMAAECAADQGKFWEFLDMNYEKQKELNSSALRAWAESLGLDKDLFDRCVRSRIKKDAVLAEYKEGEAKGVNSTPTYLVNGTKVTSSIEALSAAIDEALQRAATTPL